MIDKEWIYLAISGFCMLLTINFLFSNYPLSTIFFLVGLICNPQLHKFIKKQLKNNEILQKADIPHLE